MQPVYPRMTLFPQTDQVRVSIKGDAGKDILFSSGKKLLLRYILGSSWFNL